MSCTPDICQQVGTKKDALTPEDIVKMHVQKFGVEPRITGINFHDSLDVYDKILESIEDGKPYIEPDVPDDCDI